MRFYKSEPFEVKSMFVPDMTPWDQIFKVAEKQQQKFDKAEVEANTIDALKLRGGFGTSEKAAPEYNKKLEVLKNQASKALIENNLVGAQSAIQQAKALATSPEALTIKTDEDFAMKHPTYIMELTSKDPTAVMPFMEQDVNTGTSKVKQYNYGEIFDPYQKYGYTPTGKGYDHDYSQLLNTFHVQFNNDLPKYELITVDDPSNPGKTITMSQKTGQSIESLQREFFEKNLKDAISANPESFRAMSPTLTWEEAKFNKKITNDELINKIMAEAQGRLYTKTTPTLSQSKVAGYDESKSKKTLYPTPVSTEAQNVVDMGYYNVSTGTNKTPTTYDNAKEFLKTYNRESYLNNLLKEYNISLGTPEETLKRVKGIVSRNSDLNPNQLKQALLSANVSEDKASKISEILSDNIFNLEAQRNNLEANLDFINNKAAEGLNLKYDSKNKEYASNVEYDVINKAQIRAKYSALANSKDKIETMGDMNLIDLSSTFKRNENEFRNSNEVLTEWGKLESSLNSPNKTQIALALANPNSDESKNILAEFSTYFTLENLYTEKYQQALEKDYYIKEIKKLDPKYADYIENRDNLWSDLHKETQMGLDIYDVKEFGKKEGNEDSAGEKIKKTVGNNLDNYKFYNNKNIEVTNDVLSKKNNKFTLQTGIDENTSSIVSDPYNNRFLLKVLTGDVTDSGKVKKGENSNFIYVDITNEVKTQVKNGLLPQEFLQDFSFINSAWNEIKQLNINQEKSLDDILKQSNKIYGINLNLNLKLKRDSKEGYIITDKNNNQYYSNNKKDLLSNISQIIQTSKQLSTSTSGGDDMGKQNFFNSRNN